MSTAPATPPPDPTELIDLAVRFQDALLSSADVEVIGRTAWWDRARTAIETAAASATRFSEAVATAAKKLQITGALDARTSAEIAALAAVLDDPATFAAWRELAQADAVYVTALTRVQRTTRTATRKEKTA